MGSIVQLSGLRLPFDFDASRLKADLASLAEDGWTPHYNDRDYGGVWRGLALRSATGAAFHEKAGLCQVVFAVLGRADRGPFP